MISIAGLKDFGADVKMGLSRCLDNEAFYLKLIDMGLNDKRFEQLGQELQNNNLQAAFEHCHALKGTIGNLSLDPLFNIICKMTELLRNNTKMDYTPLYEKLMNLRKQLLEM